VIEKPESPGLEAIGYCDRSNVLGIGQKLLSVSAQSKLAQDSLLLYYNAWPGSGALPIQVVMILGEHRETDIFATTGNYKKINHDGGDL
jgi:hypothetical protein